MGTIDNTIDSNEIENRFSGLSDENKRLISDLISFNKCLNALNKFKAFIDSISNKIKTNLDSNELQMFDSLNREVEDVFRQENNFKELGKNFLISTKNCLSESDLLPEDTERVKEDTRTDVLPIAKTIVTEVVPKNTNFPLKSFRCNVESCGKWLKSVESLVVHKKCVHQLDQKLFHCDYDCCKYKTISEFDLNVHKNRHKNLQNLKTKHKITHFAIRCHYIPCGRVFDSEVSLNLHISDVHKDNECQFKCNHHLCEQLFKSEGSLKRHKKETHNVTDFGLKCRYRDCGLAFQSEDSLSQHIDDIHLITQFQFKCCYNLCGQTFESEDNLFEHIKDEHNITEFSFKCYYGCGKRFPFEDNLKYHVETGHRTAYNPYKCSARNCNKIFRFECKLKEHHKIVHEKKFGCLHRECDFFARDSKGLKNHLESHSKFKCTVERCHLAFAQKVHLKEHQAVAHPSEMLFFCQSEGCDKSFKTESGFRQHSIKHTDKVFTCEWPGCGFTSKIRSSWKLHGITHSSEMNFVCDWPECGKRFKLRNRLECHLRIHKNDKRYTCHWPGCQYRCVDSGNLSKHEKQVHKRKMRS